MLRVAVFTLSSFIYNVGEILTFEPLIIDLSKTNMLKI